MSRRPALGAREGRPGGAAAAGVLVSAALLAGAAPRTCPAAPFPIAATAAPFPGGSLEPTTARMAGMALAEYWLGDDAADNPAGALGPLEVSLAPLFLRSNRQDLRAVHREFDEQTGYFDLSSAQARIAIPDGGVAFYWTLPRLRHEHQAYLASDITEPPAVRVAEFSMREQRAGLAFGTTVRSGVGTLALGVAGEWFRREDRYELTADTQGLPSDRSEVTFAGENIGGQLGLRWDGWPDAQSRRPRLRLGAAWRRSGAVALRGEQRLGVLSGDTTVAVSARRGAVDVFGASARVALGPALSASVSLGRRGAEDHEGFGASAGPGALWALAAAYHDPRDPWGIWVGGGEDQLDGAPEPRAGLLGLGFEVGARRTSLGLGLLRRTIPSDVRPGGPHWYDYRIVASLRYTP